MVVQCEINEFEPNEFICQNMFRCYEYFMTRTMHRLSLSIASTHISSYKLNYNSDRSYNTF